MRGLGWNDAVLLGFEVLVPFFCNNDDEDAAADGSVVNVAVAVGAGSDEARRRVGNRRRNESEIRDFMFFSYANLGWSGI
jgi:hypothetical protein